MPQVLIDMPAGIAGDMFLAALIDLGGNVQRLEHDLLRLGLGPIHIKAQHVSVSGITAQQVDVLADQEPTWLQGAQVGPLKITGLGTHAPLSARPPSHQHHRPYAVIRDCIAQADLPERVKVRAGRVFRLLAEAEGQVHGVAADNVEFHEVGSIDAIADIVGCCLLLEQLDIDHIISGPLLPGEGSVRCAHGMMPVPVPAVAALLARSKAPQKRVAEETGELTTPTGCALVVGLTDVWLDHDVIVRADAVGYGAGHKRFPNRANVLRVHRLEAQVADQICELRATMDDATGEDVALVIVDLLSAGARDAYVVPVLMKKGRPGFELVVLTALADQRRIEDLILTNTPTIGLRSRICARRVLPRTHTSVDVEGHAISCKVVTLPGGGQRAKPEDDAVATAARALGLPAAQVRARALAAWQQRAAES